MADNHRWFKLWCSAPGDDGIQALPPEWRWAWAVLGCYTKSHGTDGVVVVSRSNAVLAAEMGLKPEAMFDVIRVMPHVRIEESHTRNGECTVTWTHWRKYQEDSTSGERAARHRANKASRYKRRREENRKESPPTPPATAPAEAPPDPAPVPPVDRSRSVSVTRSKPAAKPGNSGQPLAGPLAEFMATVRAAAELPRNIVPRGDHAEI